MKAIGIVVSEFYPEYAEKMVKASLKIAKKSNLKIEKIVRVYGVYDMPLAVKRLLKDKRIAGVAVLGCAVQGKSRHDKVIVESTANALTMLSIEFEKPVSLGVIGYGIKKIDAEERLTEYAERAIKSLKMTFTAFD